MAIDTNLNTRQRESLIECPSGSGQVVRAVCIKNPTSEPIPVQNQGIGASPKIYNVPVGTSEVSQALSANTKRFTILIRGSNATLQLAFVATESSTNFVTIGPGAEYSEQGINATGLVLYFQADKSGQVAEIIEWT